MHADFKLFRPRWLRHFAILLNFWSGLSAVQAQQFMLPPPRQQGAELSQAVQADRGRNWLADANGLACFDQRQGVFRPPWLQRPDDEQVVPTPDGQIWLRKGQQPVAYYDPVRRTLVRVADTTRIGREFQQADVGGILIDQQGWLWMGLSDNGAIRVNPRTLAPEPVFTDSLRVQSIAEGPDGRIWLATPAGLFAFDPRTNRTQRYGNGPAPAYALGSPNALVVSVRTNGDVLVCLQNEVDLLDPRTGRVRRILLPRSDPRHDLWTNAFVPDGRGNDYFSVGVAVFRLSSEGELQRIEFARPTEKVIWIFIDGAHAPDSPQMWVNVRQRWDVYDLDGLRPMPAFNLLDVLVNGSRLNEHEHQLEERLRRDTTGQAFLTLREGDTFQLWFTSTAERRSSRFRYRLEGYEQNWASFSDILGAATYQPRAGAYTFVFNRAKPGGGWEPAPATLRIWVEPPFYKTVWFLALCGLLMVGGLAGLYQMMARRRKLRQELARREREAANLRQLDEFKTRFVTNLTHEFRTPLTLILNATEQLDRPPPDSRRPERLASIERNANHLLRLINQLLDTAKLDAAGLDVRYSLGNPGLFVGQLVQLFAAFAEKKGLALTYRPDHAESEGWFDAEKLEAIGYNLLSNALKFTPEGGTVDVTTRMTSENHLEIRVRDTGPGIPPDELPHVFERFYQVGPRVVGPRVVGSRVPDSVFNPDQSGTGIGLAFVKEMTELLGGHVQVESEVGEGSTFTVTIPMERVVVAQTAVAPELSPSESTNLAPTTAVPFRSPNGKAQKVPPDVRVSDPARKPLLLVVEDNEELRAYLYETLSPDYRVRTAADGRAGLDQALAMVPDLVVSDVMMPRMDGHALLGALKADIRTSHVPVVLLTARSSLDSKLLGLGLGADAYLAKPFNADELRLNLRNILQTRRAWQAALTIPMHGKAPDGATADVPEKEAAFLERLRHLILRNLENKHLNVDWLAEQANLSRAQLHRKVTALTSHGTTWFINRVRLEKAEELLREGNLNVTEVAYRVGYESQSYFTRVFQEHFGYSPIRLKT